MDRDAAAVGRARKLWEAVRDGKTIFFNTATGWDIIGAANLIVPGAEVTVTKADKTTVQVIVRQVMAERTIDGVATRTATFDYVRADTSADRRPVYKVADQQAAAVGGLLGRTSPARMGYCHYCGLALDRNGNCDECR